MAIKQSLLTTNKEYKFPNMSYSGCDMTAIFNVPNPVTNKWTPYAIGSIQTLTYSIHQDKRPVRSIGNINAKDYIMGPRTIAGSIVFTVFNKHFSHDIMQMLVSSGNTKHILADELPPFDIVLTMANEYGYNSKLIIYGVRLLNEGQVMSINDIYTENTYQYVATDIDYLTDIDFTYNNSGVKQSVLNSKKSGKMTAKTPTIAVKKTTSKLQPTNVIIKVDVENETENSKGKAIFSVSPFDNNSGNLYLYQKDVNTTKVLKYPADKVMELDANNYTVYFKSSSSVSNKTDFTIYRDLLKNTSTIPGPIIDEVYSNKIVLHSNYPDHKFVKYAKKELNPSFQTQVLQGSYCTLRDLEVNKEYIIATCNDKTISSFAEITTHDIKGSSFQDIIDYINNNVNYLKYLKADTNCSLNDYINVVSIAQNQTLRANETCIDAFLKYKSQLEKDIANLSPLLPKPQYDIEKYNKMKDCLICIDIIDIVTILSNTKINCINGNSIVNAPQIEMPIANNAVVYFDNYVTSLEFFRVENNNMVPISIVKQDKFYDYNNKKAYSFSSKQGYKYIVYAYYYDAKSPKSEFYIKTETDAARFGTEESRSISQMNRDIEMMKSKLNTNYQYSKQTDSVKYRVAIEEAKKPLVRQLQKPNIISASLNNITIDSTSITSMVKVVICELNEVLLDIPKYKMSISSTTTIIPSSNFFLRKNSTYALWYEYNNKQISDVITINMFDIEEEINYKDYCKEKAINDFMTKLKDKMLINSEVMSVINSLDSKNINEYNIYEMFINLIYDLRISSQELSLLISKTYEVEFDNKYNFSLYYGSTFIDKDAGKLTIKNINEDIYLLTKTFVYKKTSNPIADSILKNALFEKEIAKDYYNMFYITNCDMTIYNGFILVDPYCNVYTYKLDVEVI